MYLNLIQLAESFGVSEAVVKDWVLKEDLPHVVDRDRLLFDRQEVADWAAARGLTKQVGFLLNAGPVLTSDMSLATLLQRGGIWRDVAAAEVYAAFAKVVGTLPNVAPAVLQVLIRRAAQPAAINMAPVGGGWALPHFATRPALGRESGTLALLLLREPLQLAEPPPDRAPIQRLLFFVAPNARAHLDVLARLGRILRTTALNERLSGGATDAELMALFAGAEAKPGEPSA